MSEVVMTLNVDYGTRRVVMPFKVEVPTKWFSDSIEQTVWCSQHFKSETYHYYSHERAWYFLREKDAAFFALRWA